MFNRKLIKTWHPTQAHQLLLKGAFSSNKKEAISAWETWKKQIDIDLIDYPSYQCLPKVYDNLRKHQFDCSLLTIIRGLYKRTWLANSILFEEIKPALEVFSQHDIHNVLIKGAALTSLHDNDYGLRPMNDFDIYIPKKEIPLAADLLMNLGWKPTQAPNALLGNYVYSFKNSPGHKITLHRSFTLDFCDKNIDKTFVGSSRPIKLDRQFSTHCLDPTCSLIFICLSGVKWYGISPIRRLTDAGLLLKSKNHRIDWDKIICFATENKIRSPFIIAFEAFEKFLEIQIPKKVYIDIRKIHTSLRKRA